MLRNLPPISQYLSSNPDSTPDLRSLLMLPEKEHGSSSWVLPLRWKAWIDVLAPVRPSLTHVRHLGIEPKMAALFLFVSLYWWEFKLIKPLEKLVGKRKCFHNLWHSNFMSGFVVGRKSSYVYENNYGRVCFICSRKQFNVHQW